MSLIIVPRMSEKTYGLSKVGKYVFNVPSKANKQLVASAVEKQFGVEVKAVNIMIANGKTKKSYRKGGKAVIGKRVDVKKAYVTLAKGQKLPVFDSVEKAEKKEAKAAAKKEEKK